MKMCLFCMEPLDEAIREIPFAGRERVHGDCYELACVSGANVFVEALLRRIEELEDRLVALEADREGG